MKLLTLRSTSIALAVACTCGTGWAQSASATPGPSVSMTAKSPAADTSFVNKATIGGMTEVKLGELASGNGQSQAVKDFGKKMVDDHTKAGTELAAIAKGKGLTPPAAPDTAHQKLVDKFGAMKGDAFDKAYWSQMLTDHKKTISLFEKEANSGKDADIKSFAAKTLPTLKTHLKMVEDAMKQKPAAMS